MRYSSVLNVYGRNGLGACLRERAFNSSKNRNSDHTLASDSELPLIILRRTIYDFVTASNFSQHAAIILIGYCRINKHHTLASHCHITMQSRYTILRRKVNFANKWRLPEQICWRNTAQNAWNTVYAIPDRPSEIMRK